MKRMKTIDAGKPQKVSSDPVLGGRKSWSRKPMTQVISNKKAEQRRSWCRKGTDDGAFLMRSQKVCV
ncbi:hypothetical protein FHS19_002759 [Paenibacillus rhizosphaerae]|uniref:Uncharacterized protein n=1 Tax=Paenibacillus rhizosphaerae TaxID=297318 RepID=A0A839TMV1_9BACL|nr:hypothetical protein [Paenibacillus rhizosphaerae]MBB3128105.1 hypothetical protein [Paenibacillus rhizosphaerae]